MWLNIQQPTPSLPQQRINGSKISVMALHMLGKGPAQLYPSPQNASRESLLHASAPAQGALPFLATGKVMTAAEQHSLLCTR